MTNMESKNQCNEEKMKNEKPSLNEKKLFCNFGASYLSSIVNVLKHTKKRICSDIGSVLETESKQTNTCKSQKHAILVDAIRNCSDEIDRTIGIIDFEKKLVNHEMTLFRKYLRIRDEKILEGFYREESLQRKFRKVRNELMNLQEEKSLKIRNNPLRRLESILTGSIVDKWIQEEMQEDIDILPNHEDYDTNSNKEIITPTSPHTRKIESEKQLDVEKITIDHNRSKIISNEDEVQKKESHEEEESSVQVEVEIQKEDLLKTRENQINALLELLGERLKLHKEQIRIYLGSSEHIKQRTVMENQVSDLAMDIKNLGDLFRIQEEEEIPIQQEEKEKDCDQNDIMLLSDCSYQKILEDTKDVKKRYGIITEFVKIKKRSFSRKKKKFIRDRHSSSSRTVLKSRFINKKKFIRKRRNIKSMDNLISRKAVKLLNDNLNKNRKVSRIDADKWIIKKPSRSRKTSNNKKKRKSSSDKRRNNSSPP